MRKVFVIEDDEEDKEFIKNAFDEVGLNGVDYYDSAYEFLARLKSMGETELSCLVVTDYKMPMLDGFNLVSFLKRNSLYASIIIVVLTGAINENERQRLIQAGISKIFIKPGSLEELKAIAFELKSLATDTQATFNSIF